jgi:hypothetical protein
MLGATVALLGAGGAGLARAGEYHVYSCRTPSGAVAPTDGWTSSGSGAFVYTEDKCAKGGPLVAALGDGYEHEGTDAATWTFTAPTKEILSGATLWRAGDADGGVSKNGTYEFWLSGPNENEAFDECVYAGASPCEAGKGEPEEPMASANRLAVPGPHLGSNLFVNAACFATLGPCKKGEHDPSGYAAVVYLYAADLILEQTSQPLVGSVAGELATASTLSGTADLSLNASDPGSGVYQAVFTVDGAPAGRVSIDENGGHCRDVGGTTDGLPAFLYLRPCAGSVSADLPFDTTALADGAHHLVVAVTDAAGNSAVALDRRIDVVNHPPAPAPPAPSQLGSPAPPGPGAANGTPASAAASLSARWSPSRRSALTARLGGARAVSGRLLAPGGTPIAGAAVQAQFLPACLGARPRQLAAARTGADGSFSLRLPASLSSGRLTLSYSARVGQAVPDVTAALTLTVPASLTLRVSPRVSHAGGTIRFAGALRGGPLPSGGKQIVLEARVATGGGAGSHSTWRQFRVLATGARGSFRASYRFRLPGPIVYQFRALSPREADFPYASGASNAVSVRER